MKYVHDDNECDKIVMGRPTIFSQEEELMFEAHILQLSAYGFPVTKLDLRMIIGCYLSDLKRKIPNFRDNLPGPDWINGFMTRHPNLSQRYVLIFV